jgi:hypothetical protein
MCVGVPCKLFNEPLKDPVKFPLNDPVNEPVLYELLKALYEPVLTNESDPVPFKKLELFAIEALAAYEALTALLAQLEVAVTFNAYDAVKAYDELIASYAQLAVAGTFNAYDAVTAFAA